MSLLATSAKVVKPSAGGADAATSPASLPPAPADSHSSPPGVQPNHAAATAVTAAVTFNPYHPVGSASFGNLHVKAPTPDEAGQASERFLNRVPLIATMLSGLPPRPNPEQAA